MTSMAAQKTIFKNTFPELGSDDLSGGREEAYLSLNLPIFITYSLIAVGYVILIYTLQYYFPIIYVSIITENYWGENATFFAYLITAFLVGRLALQRGPRFRRVVWVAAALVAAFIAFEEISWGQWVHKIGPPEWLAEINKQEELNLHNIEGLTKPMMEQSVSWLLIAWSMISVVTLQVRRRFDFCPMTMGLPIFPLRLLPIAFVVVWVFMARPFVKTGEIGELALAILALMWASDLYAHFSHRSTRRLACLLRMRRTAFVAAVALTALSSLAVKVYFPGALSFRLNVTAARDYPDLGLLEQSHEIFEYIFDNPRYLNDKTLSNYQRLFGTAQATGSGADNADGGD